MDIKTLWSLFLDVWLLTVIYLQFWHSRWSEIHKQPPEVFLKILQISQENICVGVSYLQSCKPSGCNFTKKGPIHRCFPVKFEKMWRTPILNNIWTAASVYWLLHHILIFAIFCSPADTKTSQRRRKNFLILVSKTS